MLNVYMFIQKQLAKRDEEGASAVEYGLLVAAIAAAIVLIVFLLGDVVTDVFTKTCDAVSSGAATTTQC